MKANKIIFAVVALVLAISCRTNGTQPSATSEGETPDFSILSYNVLYGLQEDSLMKARYVDWVREIDPDIVAYQEMNYFTQKSLEQFAARYDHPYAEQSKEEGFPTALTSRHPIVNTHKVVDNMWHAYIYANVNDIHIFVIHFSPHRLDKRKNEVRQILAHAALIPEGEKIVIMGDFNSLSGDDAEEYSSEYVESMRKREAMPEYSHVRNLDENGNLDFSVIGAMKNAGFIDAYRLFHPEFKNSTGTAKYGNGGKGSRIDFMWLNPELAKYAVSADIIHDAATDEMSDHYPVFVQFKLQ